MAHAEFGKREPLEPTTNRPHHSVDNEEADFSLLQIFSTLVRHWRLILGVPLLLAFLTGIWSLSQQRRYVAMLSFVPVTDNRPVLNSGALGLARQFGVNLGSNAADQSPQFYSDLLRRPTTLRKVVESQYTLRTANGGTRRGTLVDRYDIGKGGVVPAWQVAVTRLRSDMVPSVDRQSGVVQVTVSDANPHLAEQIAQRLLEVVTEFNLEARQRRAEEEARFVGGQLEHARTQLLKAENELQSFLTHNRQWQNSPELSFQHDRLERTVIMRQEVYTSLLAAHEQSRIDAMRDTPLITVIDHPAGSAQPQARGTVLRVMLMFVLSASFASVLALILELNQAGRAGRSELGRAISDAWVDARNPKRWFKRQSAVADASNS